MNKKSKFGLKKWIIILLILVNQLTAGQRKQVSLSFDDLPYVSYSVTDTIALKNLFNKLVHTLKEYQIPAIGFVNEVKLYENNMVIRYRIDLLNQWINNGFDLGNHTFSHQDYNSVPLSEFSKDILKGSIITAEILKKANRKLTYFRHPYLHVGNSKARADSLTHFLSDHNYNVAPVTIDNDDYLFATAYEKSMIDNDSILMHQIGHDYITYTGRKLTYYEKQTYKLFGRNINQILLLHPSFINSFYLDSLISLFYKNGYDFISIDAALERGEKGDFFKEEPEIPDYISKMSQKSVK